MLSARQCRQNAIDCMEMASVARLGSAKRRLLSLAGTWRNLAELTEREESLRRSDVGHEPEAA
jgi:hypothetical protein